MVALWVAACPDEANKFFAFLADAAASQLQSGAELQIMFGIGGEQDLTERQLPHLAGLAGQPPRPGRQRRLAPAAARRLRRAARRLAELVDQLGHLDPVTWPGVTRG
jgi:alpha,alpha-trehalase